VVGSRFERETRHQRDGSAPPVAAARPVRPPGPVSRFNGRYLVLAAVLGLLAALIALKGLSNAASRQQVLVAAHDLPSGHLIVDGDLAETGVAVDSGKVHLLIAGDRASVIGRATTHAVPAGELLALASLSTDPPVASDERRVGAYIKVGHYPSDLKPGDHVHVLPPGINAAGALAISARVLAANQSNDAKDAMTLVLVTPAETADALAQLVAAGDAVIVAEPRS
jgi:hypothetical protein